MAADRFARVLIFLMVVVPGIGLAPAPARAQTSDQPGPIACYLQATAIGGLDSLSGKTLCIGAVDEAPAQCANEARARLGLASYQAIILCQGARSIQPALCAAQLEATSGLDQTSISSYCAAQRTQFVPSPYGGSATCVQQASDRTMLSDQQALRLCAGSNSTEPVDCYEAGDDQTTLSDDDVIDLCEIVVPGAWG